MDNRNLEKALELYAHLITGEEVSRTVNADLYESYTVNAEVFDILDTVLKKSNLKLYEYNNALYVSAGDGNRIFGFTNDELKKEIGLRLNKELYLVYYMIFETVMLFYRTTGDISTREYVKGEVVISAVTLGLASTLKTAQEVVLSDIEETSFKTIALLWDELPMMAQNEDASSLKAARGSKIGLTKLVFNFLEEQKLFYEVGDKYYATDRFRALAVNYYEENRSRLLEIARGGKTDAAH